MCAQIKSRDKKTVGVRLGSFVVVMLPGEAAWLLPFNTQHSLCNQKDDGILSQMPIILMYFPLLFGTQLHSGVGQHTPVTPALWEGEARGSQV